MATHLIQRTFSPSSVQMGQNFTVTYSFQELAGNVTSWNYFVDREILTFASIVSGPTTAGPWALPPSVDVSNATQLRFAGSVDSVAPFILNAFALGATVSFLMTATGAPAVYGPGFVKTDIGMYPPTAPPLSNGDADVVGDNQWTWRATGVNQPYNTVNSVPANNGSLTITMICLAEGTLVRGLERAMLIEQLRRGDLVLDVNGKPVRLDSNIRFDVPSRRFVRVPANALAESVPSKDLLICHGHPLLTADGREIMPEELVSDGQAEEIQVPLEEAKHIYTLITDRRTFVDMQGAMVATWSEAAWANFIENDPRATGLRFTRQ